MALLAAAAIIIPELRHASPAKAPAPRLAVARLADVVATPTPAVAATPEKVTTQAAPRHVVRARSAVKVVAKANLALAQAPPPVAVAPPPVVAQIVPPEPPHLRPAVAPPTDPEAAVPTRARDPD
jgi:hypothetical protein